MERDNKESDSLYSDLNEVGIRYLKKNGHDHKYLKKLIIAHVYNIIELMIIGNGFDKELYDRGLKDLYKIFENKELWNYEVSRMKRKLEENVE